MVLVDLPLNILFSGSVFTDTIHFFHEYTYDMPQEKVCLSQGSSVHLSDFAHKHHRDKKKKKKKKKQLARSILSTEHCLK